MTPTEKRIYALAQKWAKAKEGQTYPIWDGSVPIRYARDDTLESCGRALLKLFKEREGRER